MHRSIRKQRKLCTAALVVALTTLVWGCSSGGDSPTETSIAPGAGSANLSGSVTVGGQPVMVGDGAAATAGVTVRIQGTSLATTTGADGRFSLAGVPGGNQVVVFEAAAGAAPLPIEAIQPGEQIEVEVTLRGSSVVVDEMTRSSQSDDEEGEEGEEDDAETAITLEIQPQAWNLEWEHSSGTVSALFRGPGFEKIDLESIVLVGTSGDEIDPTRVTRQGNNVRARFGKADALATLDDPQPGETHEILLLFTVDGEPQELTFTIRVVGDDEEDDGEDDEPFVPLSLEIQPQSWNTNWVGSNGTVSAKIQGTDFDRIDLDSVVLIGSSGDTVDPVDVSRQGNHVRARFAQSEAFASLDDPEPGQTHTVTVEFTVDGAPESLIYDIKVVGPK